MLKSSLKTIALSLITLSLLGIAYAWTEPTSTPPNGNTSIPLTTSSTAQTKAGGLWLNSGGAATGLIVEKGNVGIGTTSPSEKLEVNGNVKATAFLYSSDRNLKKNIQPLLNQLEKVLALQGVSFDWKVDNKNDIGFIAQEVEKIFPEVVHTNKETGLKSVDYAKLTVFLVEAIKEQQQEIKNQQQQQQQDIEYLKKEIENLRK